MSAPRHDNVVIMGTKHAFRTMRPGGAAGRGGAIAIVGSVAGQVGAPFQAGDSATKGATHSFASSAAIEAAQFGFNIRVNTVVPGTVHTDMAAGGMEAVMEAAGDMFPSPEALQQFVISKYPMGSLGEPLDVSNAILFLASDASAWVTGTELTVDGGLVAA